MFSLVRASPCQFSVREPDSFPRVSRAIAPLDSSWIFPDPLACRTRSTGMIPFSIKRSKPAISPPIHWSFKWAWIRRRNDLRQWPCRDRDDPGGRPPLFRTIPPDPQELLRRGIALHSISPVTAEMIERSGVRRTRSVKIDGRRPVRGYERSQKWAGGNYRWTI